MISVTIKCDRATCKSQHTFNITADNQLFARAKSLGYRYVDILDNQVLLCSKCFDSYSALESKVATEKERIYGGFIESAED